MNGVTSHMPFRSMCPIIVRGGIVLLPIYLHFLCSCILGFIQFRKDILLMLGYSPTLTMFVNCTVYYFAPMWCVFTPVSLLVRIHTTVYLEIKDYMALVVVLF